MAGFFDLTDPENAALLGIASGLLQAGAPSRLPVPFGLALARGVEGGLNAGLGRRRLDTIVATDRRPPPGRGGTLGGRTSGSRFIVPWSPLARLPLSPYGIFSP